MDWKYEMAANLEYCNVNTVSVWSRYHVRQCMYMQDSGREAIVRHEAAEALGAIGTQEVGLFAADSTCDL